MVAVKPVVKMIIIVSVFGYFGTFVGQSWHPKFEQMVQRRLKLAPYTNYDAISWLIPGPSQKLKCKMAAWLTVRMCSDLLACPGSVLWLVK